MKKYIAALLLAFSFTAFAQGDAADELTVELTRSLSKELLEANGIAFMQPLVEAINATSNSRFFSTAYIPKKDSSYFRFGVHAMIGLVREDQRSYAPTLPVEPFNIATVLGNKYIELDNGQISKIDTVGLMTYLFKTLLYDGVADKQTIKVPERAPTVLGKGSSSIVIDSAGMHRNAVARIDSINGIIKLFGGTGLNDSLQSLILGIVGQLPTNFTLPKGGDYKTMIAFVPQFEMGSLWGTEMLVRFIPPVKLSEEIGKFAFYGLGLKHSLTRYFDDPGFDLAVQGVFQITSLENTVGVTGASLKADANIMNLNIHGSKRFEVVEVYGGLSLETIKIDSRFTFLLPKEVQDQLGIIDDKPQTSDLVFKDTNIKGVLGVKKDFSNFSACLDFNFSQFNILSFGLIYKF